MRSLTTAVVSLICLGAGLYGLIVHVLPYFSAKLQPPTPVSVDMLRTGVEHPLYFGSVSGPTYDTGLTWDHRFILARRSSNTDYYGVIDLDGTYLLTYAPNPIDESRSTWVGTVRPIPEDVAQEIVAPLQAAWTNAIFFPYFLHVVEAEEGLNYWLILAVSAGAAFIGLVVLITTLIQSANPKRHPIFKRLMRFGVSLEKLAAEVENDLKKGIVKIGEFEFGRIFILKRSPTEFEVMLYRDLVWGYVKVVKDTSAGGKGRMFRRCFLHDRHGVSIDSGMSEKTQQQISAMIQQRAPWAFWGDHPDYEQMWKHGREAMAQKVERERARLRDERAAWQAEPQADPAPVYYVK